MLLTIAYCHHDLTQTLRLLRWIEILNKRLKVDALLVASRSASNTLKNRLILSQATKVFGRVFYHVPDTENERGWPASASFMFRTSLFHAEQYFPNQPVFWLEPDAVPVTSRWYSAVLSEHAQAVASGKVFTGGPVYCEPPHMTGNGVYGVGWRNVAPRLAEEVDDPWDVYAGDQVWQHCRIAPMIQHCWTRQSGHGINDLGVVKPGTVLFHQCKSGSLIRLLYEQQFQKSADGTRLFEEIRYMTKYYQCENATRKVHSLGIDFQFEVTDQLGGAWRGVYSTDNEQEIIALDRAVFEKHHGVSELTAEEFEAKRKKKSPTAPPSRRLSPVPVAVAEKVGVVVESSPVVPELVVPKSPAELPKSIDDVLQIGQVEPPVDPAERVSEKPTRSRKAKNAVA